MDAVSQLVGNATINSTSEVCLGVYEAVSHAGSLPLIFRHPTGLRSLSMSQPPRRSVFG